MRARTGLSLLLALLLAGCGDGRATAGGDERPRLMLLTALPLVWSEHFGLDRPSSPLLARLEQDYRLTLVDLPEQLPARGLLLAAQPRSLPPEQLVRLDSWVRGGGRLLLLADPQLEWPSSRPLGDPLRAPPAFVDTGLLKHWGLRLDSPDERGRQWRSLGGRAVQTVSPGSLVGGCAIAGDGLVARCRLGRGRAIIIADADLLDGERLGAAAAGNVAAVMGELSALAGRQSRGK